MIGVVRDVQERGYDIGMKPGVYVITTSGPIPGPLPTAWWFAPEPIPHRFTATRAVIAGVDAEQPVSTVTPWTKLST